MPNVSCPGCGRPLQLEIHEMQLRLECIRCGQRFVALTGELAEPPPVRNLQNDACSTDCAPPQFVDDAESVYPVQAGSGFANHQSRPGLRIVGIALLVIGLCMTLYYLLIFDTSVPVKSWNRDILDNIGPRVHNLGLLTQRIVGSVTGIGLSIVGAILYVTGSRRR
jgi:hypothetical protein